MPFEYQVEHWSTGQMAFQMPNKDPVSEAEKQLLTEHMRASPKEFNKLNKKRKFKGIYAPDISVDPPVSVAFNNKKEEGVQILHKYRVELEGSKLKLKVDLSAYKDQKSREEMLDFLTSYTQALNKNFSRRGNSDLSASIEVLGPSASSQIQEYRKAKINANSDRYESTLAYTNVVLYTLTAISLFAILGSLFIPVLIPFVMPIGIAAGVLFAVACVGAFTFAEIEKARSNSRKNEYEEICKGISTGVIPQVPTPTVELASVFSHSSVAGFSPPAGADLDKAEPNPGDGSKSSSLKK